MLHFKSAKFFIVVLVIVVGFSLFSLSNSFEGIPNRRTSQAQAHYMMGLFYENQKQFNAAVSEYREAIRLEKDIPALQLRLGSCLIRKGDFNKAALALEEAKGLDPEGLEAGLLLAFVYSRQNLSDKAAEEYEEVLKKASALEPKNALILKSLAALYYQQKKTAEAIQTYKLILALDKNDSEATFLLGSLLEEIGRRDEAINKFKEALKLNPAYPDALNSLGYIYAEEGKNLSEAEKLIQKALEAEPDNGAYIDSLGWVYFKMNLIEKAIEQLEKASLLLPEPVIYNHLAETYLKKNLLDKASNAWKKSLELDPGQDKVKEKLNIINKK